MDSEKIKGYASRVIRPPGYHIHPQWDLVHTRHLLHERRHKKKSFHLNLAPMVDMFSILVIYLIMNFSSSGEVFFISKDVTMPKAAKGLPMQSFPIISIIGDKVSFDAENVEGRPVYVEEPNDQKVPQLRNVLKKIRTIEVEIAGEKNFKGQINLQADEKTSVENVKKIMRVLIEEGWTGINFLVQPDK
ncbi:MAG: biopolymer transporter ExbD [Bdellovibrionaceae bacterium]|nr:biopolymer transporter ExbD [Pseudobdellovibrionaceae bacterium]